MTHTVTFQPGQLQLLDGSRKVFDSSLLSCALITPSKITASPTLSYPDLIKDNAYYWSRSTATPPALNHEYAIGYITALPQEWGPSAANVLADTLLGTVPTDTDYLDVGAILTRTSAPSAILGDALPTCFPQGKYMNLLGGGLVVEQANDFVRSMEIVLSGTSVYMRRRQSFAADPGFDGLWSATNNPADSGKITWGSQKGYAVAICAGSAQYAFTGGSAPQLERGSAGQTSTVPLTDTTNYASTYSTSLTITPGYFVTGAAPVAAPSTKSCRRLASGITSVGASSLTISSLPFGAADSTRFLIVAVQMSYTTMASLASISAVTIGGVSATQLAYNSAQGVALYGATVSSGTSGTIVFTFANSNVTELDYVLFGTYHLSSTTVVSSVSGSATSGSPLTLTTPSGGFAFVSGSGSGEIQGITYHGVLGSVGSGVFRNYTVGFQPTTGASISLSTLGALSSTLVGITLS